MFPNSTTKSLPKIKKAIGNFSERLTTPIGNHANRKAIFATTALLIIVVLGAAISGFSSSKNIVYASSVEGVGVGIGIKLVQLELCLSIEGPYRLVQTAP